ncbi:glutathione S-transferase N-terminal domain-containing protein [Pseudohaliea rubra]|uniref:Glutathione S-transferase n=1 Tax=Pseudohaliea rubra DSM 19751 TaxID=1265313 RepID=A0A095XZD9_9GAMM|nr:glutathione S-transferase N-terminal domain-containing protein [Pseudohaliea rubra]KGE05111.1 Glutathione S-transferase [Pseudohaliea rubra DSM 19751]
MAELLRLIGGTGSPYTRKMVALLRYRRIPYAVTWAHPAQELERLGIAPPRPVLLPTLLFEEDGDVRARCDSTPLIRRLETDYAGRSAVPTDPALAFIDYLLEDFADEWGTKWMFHYRWCRGADAAKAATVLPLTIDVSLPPRELEAVARAFGDRQIERLWVVGSNSTTAAVIEASYERFLAAFAAHLETQPCLLGRRPGASDFALFGQLSQLCAFDPTPRAIADELAPRAVAWVDRLEDLSGLEPADDDWNDSGAPPATLRPLLAEVGRVYAPALLANAAAVSAGDAEWETDIDGASWRQRSFPYQAKCLGWIREHYAALDDAARGRVASLLAGTGCEALVAV